MSKPSFSIGDALSFGWHGFKRQAWLFLGVFGAMVVFQFIFSLLPKGALFGLVSLFTNLILQILLQIGFISMTLRLVNGERASLKDLFSHAHLFLRFLAASILMGILVLLGFLLFIIPGVILSLRLWFVGFVLVDMNVGPVEALRRSWDITRGATLRLLLFGVVLALVNLAGLLALFVGIFVSVPVTLIAVAYVYRTLTARAYDGPARSSAQSVAGGPAAQEPSPVPDAPAAAASP